MGRYVPRKECKLVGYVEVRHRPLDHDHRNPVIHVGVHPTSWTCCERNPLGRRSKFSILEFTLCRVWSRRSVTHSSILTCANHDLRRRSDSRAEHDKGMPAFGDRWVAPVEHPTRVFRR